MVGSYARAEATVNSDIDVMLLTNAAPSWAEVPIDAGTLDVVRYGMLIVYDPQQSLAKLREAGKQMVN